MPAKKSAPPPDEPEPVSFDTELTGFGTNTGIVVPPDVVERLRSGKRPPVSVELNGFTFRSTVAVMSGEFLIGVSAATRKQTGLQAGDPIHVTLTLATEARAVDMPDDFAAALAAEPAAAEFFGRLANSLQRMHVDSVNGAKSADTRQRRIDKAVALFLAGEQR